MVSLSQLPYLPISMAALQEFTAKSVKEAERLQKWRKDLVRQVRKREKGIVV